MGRCSSAGRVSRGKDGWVWEWGKLMVDWRGARRSLLRPATSSRHHQAPTCGNGCLFPRPSRTALPARGRTRADHAEIAKPSRYSTTLRMQGMMHDAIVVHGSRSPWVGTRVLPCESTCTAQTPTSEQWQSISMARTKAFPRRWWFPSARTLHRPKMSSLPSTRRSTPTPTPRTSLDFGSCKTLMILQFNLQFMIYDL